MSNPTRHIFALMIMLCTPLFIACEEKPNIPEPNPASGIVSILDAGSKGQKTGWWPRMDVDQRGHIHLAYCDVTKGDLRYGYRDASGWHLETALSKGAVGKYIGIAVDQKNTPAIIFYDQDQKFLRFAKKNADGTWHSERIAWGLEIGMGGELIFDRHNTAHAFYYITSGQLIHAKQLAPGEWQKKPLTDAIGSFTVRISVKEYRDSFWITYMDWDLRNSRLYLGKLDGDQFHAEKVADRLSPGWRSYLFFVNDAPQIIFTQSVKSQMRWAKRGTSGWESQLIMKNAGNFSAYHEPTKNVLYIAYEDYGIGLRGSNIKLLKYENKAWQHLLIDPKGPAGTYIDLAVHNNTEMVLAYYAEPIHGLRIYEEGLQGKSNEQKR